MDEFKAFLFDLNGTMIDDMDYHVRSWHRILNELGAVSYTHLTLPTKRIV